MDYILLYYIDGVSHIHLCDEDEGNQIMYDFTNKGTILINGVLHEPAVVYIYGLEHALMSPHEVDE